MSLRTSERHRVVHVPCYLQSIAHIMKQRAKSHFYWQKLILVFHFWVTVKYPFWKGKASPTNCSKFTARFASWLSDISAALQSLKDVLYSINSGNNLKEVMIVYLKFPPLGSLAVSTIEWELGWSPLHNLNPPTSPAIVQQLYFCMASTCNLLWYKLWVLGYFTLYGIKGWIRRWRYSSLIILNSSPKR